MSESLFEEMFQQILCEPDLVKKLDPDVAAMDVEPLDKLCLQIYRNYSRSFEKHRFKQFIAEVDALAISVDELARVQSLIVSQDARSLPVIFCAFADERLLEMFRREIPSEVPGGRNELLSGFGSLSRLAQRIQIAYAFGWLSWDVLVEVNHLRKLRNEISHSWDVCTLEQKLSELIDGKQHRVEEELGDDVLLPKDFGEGLMPLAKFRVRLVWYLGRVFYETALWVPAVKAHLSAHDALYSIDRAPALLSKVTKACIAHTKLIIEQR